MRRALSLSLVHDSPLALPSGTRPVSFQTSVEPGNPSPHMLPSGADTQPYLGFNVLIWFPSGTCLHPLLNGGFVSLGCFSGQGRELIASRTPPSISRHWAAGSPSLELRVTFSISPNSPSDICAHLCCPQNTHLIWEAKDA